MPDDQRMTTTEQTIKEYQDTYTSITGMGLQTRGLFDHRTQFWWRFSQAFTLDDLAFVLRHLLSKIRKGERNIGCLRFSNLIERPELFEEELGMARAEARNKRPPTNPKESVIRSLPTVRQGSPREMVTAKPVAAYIAALREAAR